MSRDDEARACAMFRDALAANDDALVAGRFLPHLRVCPACAAEAELFADTRACVRSEAAEYRHPPTFTSALLHAVDRERERERAAEPPPSVGRLMRSRTGLSDSSQGVH